MREGRGCWWLLEDTSFGLAKRTALGPWMIVGWTACVGSSGLASWFGWLAGSLTDARWLGNPGSRRRQPGGDRAPCIHGGQRVRRHLRMRGQTKECAEALPGRPTRPPLNRSSSQSLAEGRESCGRWRREDGAESNSKSGRTCTAARRRSLRAASCRGSRTLEQGRGVGAADPCTRWQAGFGVARRDLNGGPCPPESSPPAWLARGRRGRRA